MTRRRPVVAIDGPAGAGKSTVTQLVAQRLRYALIGTGSIYRAVALLALQGGVAADDGPALARLAASLSEPQGLRFIADERGAQRVLLGERDVTQALRDEEVSRLTSQVAALPEVRAALLELQRALGREGAVVLEGRDIGTVVFPDAEAKFFLTASLEVRAARRHRELLARGEALPLEDVQREVELRDRRDEAREAAPLRRADDALLVDSSAATPEQVAELIVERVRRVEEQLAGRA